MEKNLCYCHNNRRITEKLGARLCGVVGVSKDRSNTLEHWREIFERISISSERSGAVGDGLPGTL